MDLGENVGYAALGWLTSCVDLTTLYLAEPNSSADPFFRRGRLTQPQIRFLLR